MLIHHNTDSEEKAKETKEQLESTGAIIAILVPEGIMVETTAIIEEVV